MSRFFYVALKNIPSLKLETTDNLISFHAGLILAGKIAGGIGNPGKEPEVGQQRGIRGR